MSTTYCSNDDLILDEGKTVLNSALLDRGLSSSEKTAHLDRLRLQAYNFINDNYLKGKTAIPANHIPSLKYIEKDLVLSFLLKGTLSIGRGGSDYSGISTEYHDRAIEALDKLRWGASASSVTAASGNASDGTITVSLSGRDFFTRTERWELTAISATQITVWGSIHGYLRNFEIANPYPDPDWTTLYEDYDFIRKTSGFLFAEYPISLTWTDGSVTLTKEDKWTFWTYAALKPRPSTGKIKRA